MSNSLPEIPRNPPLTLAIIGVSVAVYGLMVLGLEYLIVGSLLISEYIPPSLPEVMAGELWRLITPIFLHFGIFHIVFNMLWTWELGRLIEWRQGPVMLGVLVVSVALVSNLAQYFITGPLFGGMSGVVYGLFGYVWIQGLTNPKFAIRLNPVIVKFMLGWFVICWSGLLEKFFGVAVANTAHTAGLLMGVAVAFAYSGAIRLFKK